MGFWDFSLGWQLMPIFSLIGLVINVIAFRRGAKAGCSGLALGSFGFVATAIGFWVAGLIILLGLAFITFKQESATAKAAREARSQQPQVSYRQPSSFSGRATTDISNFKATYDDEPVRASAGDSLEVADQIGADLDADVHQIEEDFIQGRIDRDTYVMRRRELLG